MNHLKRRLGNLRRKFYKTSNYITMKFSRSLVEIGSYYGTDKGNKWHTFKGKNYLDVYEIYLRPLRKLDVTLLEIGVRNGQSLNMWKEYFPGAHIYGLDIDPRCQQFASNNISIYTGSQDDRILIEQIFESSGEFDLIVDDGSHVNELTLASFSLLFGKLKSGGIYIIEDLGCSYLDLSSAVKEWPGMEYNDPGINYMNDREIMNEFFLQKIKEMDHLQGAIRSIHFWPLICCILKA